MTDQLALSFEAVPDTAFDISLTCAFGEPWMGPHPLCEAEVERLCAAFDAAVGAGAYDREGYTPAERRAVAFKARSGGGGTVDAVKVP